MSNPNPPIPSIKALVYPINSDRLTKPTLNSFFLRKIGVNLIPNTLGINPFEMMMEKDNSPQLNEKKKFV